MHKKILTIAFLLIFTLSLIGYPLTALSADEVSFTADTTISLDNGLSFLVLSGSLVDQMVVYSTYVVFTLSGNSSITLRSNDKYRLSNTLSLNDCEASPNYSQITLPAQSSSTDVTVTPSSSTCPSWGGTAGGGGVTPAPTPTTPTTTTGQVTVTPSEGGKTTLTTDENSTAQIEVPVNAVSTSTEINIYSKDKADIVASRPIPSGKSVVGNYIFEYTATANGEAVATFSIEVTLTFTYTDSQIVGLNEDVLKIYYWDDSQWLNLASTVDKVNNTITVTTDHFTYFAIFGESETPIQMATPEDYGLTEGDLIRAEGDFDIFIINQYGYKRLFLNPVIFEMYGHLGSWEDVKTVTSETRDAFITSTHYRYVNEDKVYHLEVTGEDTGILQWINMTADDFLSQSGEPRAIFTINKSELDWYPKGLDLTSL